MKPHYDFNNWTIHGFLCWRFDVTLDVARAFYNVTQITDNKMLNNYIKSRNTGAF
jgi:hypothetical protein